MNKIFLPWKDAYSVNVVELDNQHKMLIDILNNLYNAFINKEHGQKIDEMISKLCNYVEIHFTKEEKYFHRFNYDDTAEHIKEHEYFIEKINSFKDNSIKDRSNMIYGLINFLREWLNNHILVVDKKYVHCFSKNGLR